jgi:hypothetical protein
MLAGKMCVFPEKLKLAGSVRGGKLLDHEPAEQCREHWHRQEQASPAGGCARTAGEMPPPAIMCM